MITHVAVRYKGDVYALPKPYRHHHIIHQITMTTGDFLSEAAQQGFLDDLGTFLSRTEALAHAIQWGQTIRRTHSTLLFSEDLW